MSHHVMSATLIKQPRSKKKSTSTSIYYVIWRQWESHYNLSNWQGMLPLAFKGLKRLYCNLQDTM